MRERTSHAHISEHRPVEIETHRHDAVAATGAHGRLRHDDARIFAEPPSFRPWNRVQVVDFSRLQRQYLRPWIRDNAEYDGSDVRRTAEIVLVRRQPDLRVRLIGHESKRTGADWRDVRRIAQRVSALIQMPRNDRRFCHVELLQERCIRSPEAKLDR